MASTDKFYNAPEGPSVQPEEELPRRARMDISVSPEMFGASIGRGLEQLGQGATKASDFFSQISADQATNGFIHDKTNILYGTGETKEDGTVDTGFMGLRGQAAIDAAPGVRQALQDAYEHHASGVPGAARVEYDRWARRELDHGASVIGAHGDQQHEQWAGEVNSSTTYEASNAINKNPLDDKAFDLNQSSMVNAAVKEAMLKYGIDPAKPPTPDGERVKNEAASKARAIAAAQRIEAVKDSNPAQAVKWLDQYKADLSSPMSRDGLGRTPYERLSDELRKVSDAQDTDASVKAKYAEADSGGARTQTAQADQSYYAKIPRAADPYAKIPPKGEHGEDQLSRFRQWNPDPVGNSAAQLSTVHPDLQAIVRRAQQENPDLPFVVALGKSTPEQEKLAQSWGWGQAGTGGSHHLQGNVVDLWPLDKQGHVQFDPKQQKKIADAMQKSAGELGLSVKWGGLQSEGGGNKNFRDAPNFMLDNPRAEAPTVTSSASFTGASPYVQSTMLSAGITGVSVPREYAPIVQASSNKWGVDPSLLSRQLQQESGYRDVRSPAGAEGIAQFIPGTAARYGVNVHDAQSSIDGAAHYMHDLLDMFGGNKGLALAGYNWGEGNVQAWLRNGADPSRLPKETRDYVQIITGHQLSDWVANPGIPIRTVPLGPGQSKMGIGTALPEPPGPPQFLQPEGPTFQQASFQPGQAPTPPGQPEGPQPSSLDVGPKTAAPAAVPFISPPPPSQWDMVRDRTSAAMLSTITDDSIPSEKKDKMLAQMERDMRFATYAAQQDKETRQRHSEEAVDNALDQTMKGDYAGAYSALGDAFQKRTIDAETYQRATGLIEKRSGQLDPAAYGPRYHDALDDILKTPGATGRVNSLSDLLNMEDAGDISALGYQKLKSAFEDANAPEKRGFIVKTNDTFKRAEKFLKWEIQGPTAGTSIPNPRGDALIQDFDSKFYGDLALYKGDLEKFPYFDSEKLGKILSDMYPEREKEMNMAGMSAPSKNADVGWTPLPPPPQTSSAAWYGAVANPPTASGQTSPVSHALWDKALRDYVFGDEAAQKVFNESNMGHAIGNDAATLRQWLSPSAKRGPEGAERNTGTGQPPEVYPGVIQLPEFKIGPVNPGGVFENWKTGPNEPTLKVPMPEPPEMPPAEAAPWIPGQ